MALRSTMAALIDRVRLLINDPRSASQQFDDGTIQDILDESRRDLVNFPLRAEPTFSGATIQYLDYYAGPRDAVLGGFEDGMVLKQYLTVTVTPSLIEPIAGHFQFAQSTFPPIYCTGKIYDVYRAAADLLERWAARWALSYTINVDGQTLHREGASTQLLNLAKTYRRKQRPGTITFSRGDLNTGEESGNVSLGARDIDYMSSG